MEGIGLGGGRGIACAVQVQAGVWGCGQEAVVLDGKFGCRLGGVGIGGEVGRVKGLLAGRT